MDDLISTLVLPTERPPVALDVKRALLTFDQVNLCAPDDREIVNPISFMTATMPIPLPFAFGTSGPVLPLGKLPGYDEAFAELLTESDFAVRQGSVVVRTSPELMTQGTVLGHVPNPEGWPSPNWVMGLFRTLVSQRDVLLSACKGLPSEEDLRRVDLDTLAPGGAALTQGFGGPPQIADLNDGSISTEIAGVVQRLAATRLGSTIKCVGLCENVGLYPWSGDTGLVALLEHFQRTSASSVSAALQQHSGRDDVQRAMRVERVIFSHDLPDAVLTDLSVKEVLALRTEAWGKEGRARSAFFATIRRLSSECPNDAEFDRAVSEAIDSYAVAKADLADEWIKLGAKVGLPFLAGAVTASGNILQSMLGMPGWSIALGVTAAGTTLSGVIDEVVTIFRQRRDLAAHAGKALVTPYAFALRK